MQTDSLLLMSCVEYETLGFELTTEMHAFCRWHVAVYPHEKGDKIKIKDGYVHDLLRIEQLEFGEFLLERYREHQPSMVDDNNRS